MTVQRVADSRSPPATSSATSGVRQRRRQRAAGTWPASATRWSTSSSTWSSRRPTGPAWSLAPERSTASSCGASTSSRTGTSRPSASPTGTSSRRPAVVAEVRARLRHLVARRQAGGSARPPQGRDDEVAGHPPSCSPTSSRRLLLIVPTLFGIMVVNFIVVQAAPGGPVELMIARLKGTSRRGHRPRGRLGHRGDGGPADAGCGAGRRGEQQVPRRPWARSRADPPARAPVRLRPARPRALPSHAAELRHLRLRHQLLPRPPRDRPDRREAAGLDLAGPLDNAPHLPVSIPLGVAKAIRDGSTFDVWTSARRHRRLRDPRLPLRHPARSSSSPAAAVFAWFPLRGLVSDHWAELSWPARILDYFWHIVLPVDGARGRAASPASPC